MTLTVRPSRASLSMPERGRPSNDEVERRCVRTHRGVARSEQLSPTRVVARAYWKTCKPEAQAFHDALPACLQDPGRGLRRPRPETERKLRSLLGSLKPDSRQAGEASSRFKVGTRIVREWKGKTHEVTITPDGYCYNGEVYKSLSPIANLITGSRWSGPAFFGTKLKEAK